MQVVGYFGQNALEQCIVRLGREEAKDAQCRHLCFKEGRNLARENHNLLVGYPLKEGDFDVEDGVGLGERVNRRYDIPAMLERVNRHIHGHRIYRALTGDM